MKLRTRRVGRMRKDRRDRSHTVRSAASVLRMKELSVGDAAPDLVLLDREERPVFLSALWKERPLALIFLRHFG
jgi:hypothetical protein